MCNYQSRSTSQLAQFLLQRRGAGEILVNSDMNSDKARERAEKSFKKEERAQDGRKAMIEYEFSGTSHSREDRAFEGASIG